MAENSKLTMLIVDDDIDLIRSLKVVLRRLFPGCRLLEALSVSQAVGVLDSIEPDVVLTDLSMPGRDGYELMAHIRARSPGAWVPVIVISAYDHADTEIDALLAGADDFLSKPLSTNLLHARLISHLRRRVKERGHPAAELTY